MMWDTTQKPQAVQQSLFPELNEEESRIVQALEKYTEGAAINTLVIETNLPVHRLSATLFELELRDIVRPLAGSIYKLRR